MAEAVQVPWMKKGRATSFINKKIKARGKLLSGQDEDMVPVKG